MRSSSTTSTSTDQPSPLSSDRTPVTASDCRPVRAANCRSAAPTAELRSPVPLDEAREEEPCDDAELDDRVRDDADFFVGRDRDDDVDALDRAEADRDRPPESLFCPLAAAILLPTQRAERASTAPDLGGVPRLLWD